MRDSLYNNSVNLLKNNGTHSSGFRSAAHRRRLGQHPNLRCLRPDLPRPAGILAIRGSQSRLWSEEHSFNVFLNQHKQKKERLRNSTVAYEHGPAVARPSSKRTRATVISILRDFERTAQFLGSPRRLPQNFRRFGKRVLGHPFLFS